MARHQNPSTNDSSRLAGQGRLLSDETALPAEVSGPDTNAPEVNMDMASDVYRRFSRAGLRRQRLRHWRRKLSWLVLVQSLAGAKRAMDVIGAGGLLLCLAPVIAFIFSRQASKGDAFIRIPRIGRWGEPFDEYALSLPENAFFRGLSNLLRLHRLPVLINIFKGDMSFVGPRPIAPDDMIWHQRAARLRLDVRPGLVCLWWIRRRANIDYGDELESDRDYVISQSLKQDLAIAGRAIPALFYGESPLAPPDTIELLGITVYNLTMTETLAKIMERIEGARASQLCFVNADCLNRSYGDPDYLEVLRHADLTLADGIGLKLAGKLLAQPVKQNVNGTDLFPRLCATLSGTGHGLFLLGAQPGVAEGMRDWIAAQYPDVHVCGWQHGYFTPEQEPEVIQRIADANAAVLLVAFGAPRQDLWLHAHLPELNVQVAMGVGGLFDFYSGRIPRAPLWMREMGMEWLFRFYQEPSRMWKRYFIGNALFLMRVLRDRYRQRRRSYHYS